MEELGVEGEMADGGKIISFAHYDYLGIGRDERVLQAAYDAVSSNGVGPGASRLVGGELQVHRDLERDLADFVGVEDSLALVSGYGTNVGLVGHLMTRGDLILVDEAAHNSIMTGSQLSRAETMMFRHNDLDHLSELLRAHRQHHRRAVVLVEGLYSMDGDIPDLPRLLEICRSHNAWTIVDEAHSVGVLGATGRGICEHFGIAPTEVDLIVGTLSKAFVTCGGFIGGKRGVIDWLRFTLPGFVYSVGMTPLSAAAARCAVGILRDEPERLEQLRSNSSYFIDGALARGFEVGTAYGAAVIPVHFESVETAMLAARAALDAGFYVPPIVQIAVPKDAPRMRFFLTTSHTQAQIDAVLDVIMPFAARSGGASEAKIAAAE